MRTSQVEGEVSSIKAGPKERGPVGEGVPLCSRRLSHLADIQVLLQVIGVIELQDSPECGPLLALPGDGHGRREKGGQVSHPNGTPTLVPPHTPPPAQAAHSLIGQEDAEVPLQAKKLGQVHGRWQVPWSVYKLGMGQEGMGLEQGVGDRAAPASQGLVPCRPGTAETTPL